MGARVPKEVTDKRREIVASLLARGLSQTEIFNTLSQPKYADEMIKRGDDIAPNPHFVGNPETGEPFDKSTISRDVKYLLKAWQENAKTDSGEHFARQLAELTELKRAAWAARNLTEIRQCLALEMKLLGTARPEKKEIRWDDNQLNSMNSAKDRVREKVHQMMENAGLLEGDL